MKLDDYRKCFDLHRDQFIALHNIPGDKLHENVRYEKIADVTRVDLGNNQYFFFNGGQLKMIYISDETLTKEIWREFENLTNTNTPEKIARSRAGKTSNQLIFAGQGFSASIHKDNVDFIEIYSACPLQHYLKNIYEEPQPFIR